MTPLFQASARQLTRLHDVKALRLRLLQRCKNAGIKGDVLLSTEGIQLRLVGERNSLEALLSHLPTLLGLEQLAPDFTELGFTTDSRIRVRIARGLGLDDETPVELGRNGKREPVPERAKDGTITMSDQLEEQLSRRHQAIERFTTPLPGSAPYDNHRPIWVPRSCDGATLLDFLCTVLPHISRNEWRELIFAGHLLDCHHQPMASTARVKSRDCCYRLYPGTTEPNVNPKIRVLYEDDAIVVIHKPAPLPMHPGGRFNRNTLQAILQQVYHPEKLRPAHRLDANTTGLIVFSRGQQIAGNLQSQFENGRVQKTYLAKIQGHPTPDQFRCDAPIRKKPGRVSNREVDPHDVLSAQTEFTVLQRLDDGTTLVKAVPLSGRTHQIRIHLWSLGLPICGDSVYLPGGHLGDTQTLSVDATPLCLHAWKLSFWHPEHQLRQHFVAPPPDWVVVDVS